MNILLVGGHQKTQFLLKKLKLRQHSITVVNENSDFCTLLADEYEVNAVCGDGTNPETLQLARTDKMDMLVALQHKDASNLLICELAKRQFHVPKTVAVISDPNNIELFREMGVDRCLCTTDFLSDMIEQETISDHINNYFEIDNGKVLIFECAVPETSPVLGQKLWEIGLPPQSIIGSIIRGNETIIPQGNTELKKYDRAIIISTLDASDQTLEILTGKKNRHRF